MAMRKEVCRRVEVKKGILCRIFGTEEETVEHLTDTCCPTERWIMTEGGEESQWMRFVLERERQILGSRKWYQKKGEEIKRQMGREGLDGVWTRDFSIRKPVRYCCAKPCLDEHLNV